MFFGAWLFIFMPSSPATTRLLTPEERRVAVERIRENKTGINNPHFKKYQLLEALKGTQLVMFFPPIEPPCLSFNIPSTPRCAAVSLRVGCHGGQHLQWFVCFSNP